MAQPRQDREERAVKLLTTQADQELAQAFYRDLGMLRNVLNECLRNNSSPGQILVAVFEAAAECRSFVIQPKAALAPQGQRVQAEDRDGNVVTLHQLSISFIPSAGQTTNITKYMSEYSAEPFAHHRMALQCLVQEALMCRGEAFVLGTNSSGVNNAGFVQVYNLAAGLTEEDFQRSWPKLKALSDWYDRGFFGQELSQLVDPNSDSSSSDQLKAIVEDGKAEGARPHIVNMGTKAERMLRFLDYHDSRGWYYKAMDAGAAKTSARTSSSSARNTSRAADEEMKGDEDIPF